MFDEAAPSYFYDIASKLPLKELTLRDCILVKTLPGLAEALESPESAITKLNLERCEMNWQNW